MKLNKYKKLLKEEFEDTINPIEIKEEKKNYNFNHKFKFRYVFLPLLAVLLLYLVIDQIAVSITNEEIKKYNTNISNEKIDYDSINISEKKYESKLELENAIVKYEIKQRKELKKSTLEKIFSFQLIGCTSQKTMYDTSPRADLPTESNSSYDTNVVEKSVDEADVSKCDGAYIYSLYEKNIYIYDLAGNVVLTNEFLNYPLNMYVYNDKVVIIFKTNVNVYEFSNSKLELKAEYDNHLVNSRLYKNNLFMVFDEKLDLDKINYDNCYYDGTINPNYVFKILKIDLNNLEAIEADLVTTSNNQFYMSENYIYFTSRLYNYSFSDYNYDYTNFFIIDHNLNGYSCFKKDGYLLNKYSMSEYEGYFRFLMIDTHSKKFFNTLYTYDLEKKEKASKLEEIGLEYEYAKSVRFDKEKCYVCTYRRTDPLYLIDLSDPYDIKIVSELHVTGYSDYLHYFKIKDETYILGVGYNESGLPKLSIYKEENNALIQYKNNLIISYYVNDKMISFENEKYLKVDDTRFLNENAIGYFFYVKDDIIYFGSQLGDVSYYMFKIDVESDELFTVYDKYESNKSCVRIYKDYIMTYLRCYLIENKLYYFGDGNIIIKDF
jgi:uncharacterized secreted protein with C-terminal beta-propeller domain